MRDIKFRVRNLEKNKFESLEDIVITFDSIGIEIYTNSGSILDNYELNRYTELNDMDGREVYEGDIVEYTDGHFERRRGKITFELYGFILSEINGEQLDFLGNIDDDEEMAFKVVGNIYENPEMLEVHFERRAGIV